jgi:hypothetical protein
MEEVGGTGAALPGWMRRSRASSMERSSLLRIARTWMMVRSEVMIAVPFEPDDLAAEVSAFAMGDLRGSGEPKGAGNKA